MKTLTALIVTLATSIAFAMGPSDLIAEAENMIAEKESVFNVIDLMQTSKDFSETVTPVRDNTIIYFFNNPQVGSVDCVVHVLRLKDSTCSVFKK